MLRLELLQVEQAIPGAVKSLEGLLELLVFSLREAIRVAQQLHQLFEFVEGQLAGVIVIHLAHDLQQQAGLHHQLHGPQDLQLWQES